MPNDSSAVANSSNRSRLMLRKNPPCIRIRSVWVPGGRMRSWPTSSSEKLRAGKTKVRVRSVPFGPGVALGVRPGARDELNGQRPGVELPVERIAKGDVVDLEDLGVEDQVLAVGARERELVAVDRLRVDASLVGRIERDVDPRPALERSGRRRRGGAGRLRVDLLLLHRVAGDVLPAPRDEGQRHGRVAELAAEEIAVGVREIAAGVAQPDRRGVELDVVIGAAGDRELWVGVED